MSSGNQVHTFVNYLRNIKPFFQKKKHLETGICIGSSIVLWKKNYSFMKRTHGISRGKQKKIAVNFVYCVSAKKKSNFFH